MEKHMEDFYLNYVYCNTVHFGIAANSQQPTSMIIVSALYNNRGLFKEDCLVIHISIKQ